jgi:hypothetical protein
VCVADELLRLRARKILSFSDAISRETAFENVQETQSAFDALFVSVSNTCSDMPMEQLIDVTRHIMATNSDAFVAALSAAPLSPAATKCLKHSITLARAKTSSHFEKNAN